jgi:hypothetical protein
LKFQLQCRNFPIFSEVQSVENRNENRCMKESLEDLCCILKVMESRRSRNLEEGSDGERSRRSPWNK